jgi:hypothetical protein
MKLSTEVNVNSAIKVSNSRESEVASQSSMEGLKWVPHESWGALTFLSNFLKGKRTFP